jgi:hypothetical protein
MQKVILKVAIIFFTQKCKKVGSNFFNHCQTIVPLQIDFIICCIHILEIFSVLKIDKKLFLKLTCEMFFKTIFTLKDLYINHFYIGSWKCISKFLSGINQESKKNPIFHLLKPTSFIRKTYNVNKFYLYIFEEIYLNLL